jgi:nucleoside-diphosphate-sugar epimerase
VRIGITFYPAVGGSGTVATELGLHLARRDHEVHFIAQRLLMRPGESHENVRFHEVDRTSLSLFDDPPNDLALAAKMADVARESRLEILHVH